MPYKKEQHDERMSFARAYLGGKCVGCGATDSLEVDHIDPATKAFELSSGTRNGWPKFIAELDKCQLLCTACHYVKSKAEQSIGHGEGLTGKKSCYCALCAPVKAAYQRGKYLERKAVRQLT